MRRFLVCLIALIAGRAHADMTAVYEKPDKSFRMTVEMVSNGDVRVEVAAKPGMYLLTLKGKCYAIGPTPAGTVVDRCEDAAAAAWTVANERFPDFSKMMEAAGKMKMPQGDLFTQGGTVTVQGRRGMAYSFARSPQNVAPLVVISSDPELAPLGQLMARQLEISTALSPVQIANPVADQMKTLVKTGGPLLMFGAELTTFSHDPIDPVRFALPGPVEDRETITRRLRSTTTGTSVQAF
jgi:hypothetical protein